MHPTETTFSPSIQAVVPGVNRTVEPVAAQVTRLLDRAFGVEFSVVDGHSGELLKEGVGQPIQDHEAYAELCRQVAQRGRAEFIADEDPFVVLALPIEGSRDEDSRVAVATFVTRPIGSDEDLLAAARLVGLSTEQVNQWAHRQTVWPVEMIRRVADLTAERLMAGRRVEALDHEVRSLSSNLSSTYEEISLLYRLTQNLSLSATDEELGKMALEGLEEVIPAVAFGLLMLPVVSKEEAMHQQARSSELLLTQGNCPVSADALRNLITHLGLHAQSRPLVANPPVTQKATWPVPAIRQLIVVPLCEGENLFGWLVVINHRMGGEFGTIEANLVNSVATILGIHSGNIELYRQQSEMFAGVVGAMVSAIDAKDPYTRGHSDRVARISVCLARELDFDQQTLNSIYLSGLLHDIGKIGIDDRVLRKPGSLTSEEYEHIKSHVTVGHRILCDLKKMEHVLPVVLHHHESWNGGGYPHDLKGRQIPLTARIVAVADAFDAMSSDRPYRQGMPDEKIDAIFRDGSGKQWDPVVVDAFFRVRDEIREICRREREGLEDDIKIWTQ